MDSLTLVGNRSGSDQARELQTLLQLSSPRALAVPEVVPRQVLLNADHLKTLLASRAVIVMVGVLGAVLLFASLGRASLFDWDEAVYAERAKEMVRTGDWVTLQRGRKLSFEKPPMYVWTTAVFFRLFEVSEFWARVPSALSGLGLVILTVVLATPVYGRVVGLLSALILLMSTGFLWFARSAALEVMFT